jgi:hypothetical protein
MGSKLIDLHNQVGGHRFGVANSSGSQITVIHVPGHGFTNGMGVQLVNLLI